MNTSTPLYCASAAVSFVFIFTSRAAIVNPAGYTFDQPTGAGSFVYSDPSLTKLTDGVYGTSDWWTNGGVDWDGWVNTPAVNIDFNFNGVKSLNKISVGTVQDNLGDVVMPNVTVYSSVNGGSTWSLVGTVLIPASGANDGQYRTVVFDNLNVSANAMRIALGANGPWTFTDEITFEAVPEPSTYLAGLSALGMLGLFGWRNRN